MTATDVLICAFLRRHPEHIAGVVGRDMPEGYRQYILDREAWGALERFCATQGCRPVGRLVKQEG